MVANTAEVELTVIDERIAFSFRRMFYRIALQLKLYNVLESAHEL